MSLVSNLGSYFNSLHNTFKKKDIVLDLTYSTEELAQTIQPMFMGATNLKLTGEVVNYTNTQFKRILNKPSATAYDKLWDTIEMILENEDEIIEMVTKEFHDETVKAVTDYHKLNILKYVEGIHLFNNYARRWINAAVFESTKEKDEKLHRAISSPTLLSDARYVTNFDNVNAVCAAINMLSIPVSKFLNEIKDLKGHTFNEEDWNGGNSLINSKFDPFKSGFIPVTWNPIYHLGMAVNAWRVERYERNKSELARLQFMLMGLQEAKTASSDPERVAQLEKQINYYSNLSNKITAKIEAMEEKD